MNVKVPMCALLLAMCTCLFASTVAAEETKPPTKRGKKAAAKASLQEKKAALQARIAKLQAEAQRLQQKWLNAEKRLAALGQSQKFKKEEVCKTKAAKKQPVGSKAPKKRASKEDLSLFPKPVARFLRKRKSPYKTTHVQEPGLRIPYASNAPLSLQPMTLVTISETAIYVNERKVCPIQRGHVHPNFKKDRKASGYLILPLYEKLKEAASFIKKVAKYTPRVGFSGRIRLLFDRGVRFRLLSEVMYTAGQAEFARFFFTACQKRTKGPQCRAKSFPLIAPRLRPPRRKVPARRPLNLTVSMTDKGFTLIARGDKVTRGCALTPKALLATPKQLPTLPKKGTNHDFAALRGCLQRFKRLFPRETMVIIMAEPEMSYGALLKAISATYTDAKGKPLFPRIVISAGVI